MAGYKKRREDRGVRELVFQVASYLAISRMGVAVPTPDVVLVLAHW